MVKKYVIDTSAFMTENIRDKDDSMEEAIVHVLALFERCRDEEIAEFYMPDSTYEELEEILEDSVDEDVVRKLKSYVERRSPSRHEVSVPGDMLYGFIEEMRKRVNKGLRLSEKAVKDLDEMDEEPEEEYYDQVDVIISDLRGKYKEALRKGIVDSKEDLDLLLLARELDATVVSEDRGVLNWAEELGLTHLEGNELPEVLEEYLD